MLAAALLLAGAGCAPQKPISSFAECAAAGNPVMESYPRQCRADGRTFVEDVSPPIPSPLPPEPTPPPAVPFGMSASFSIGEARRFDDGLEATLLRIDDSRCPKDAQCVWAGELAPVFTLRGGRLTEGSVTVTLGTLRSPSAEAGPYVVTLREASEDRATVEIAAR